MSEVNNERDKAINVFEALKNCDLKDIEFNGIYSCARNEVTYSKFHQHLLK
jgi:hypothetical protein